MIKMAKEGFWARIKRRIEGTAAWPPIRPPKRRPITVVIITADGDEINELPPGSPLVAFEKDVLAYRFGIPHAPKRRRKAVKAS